MRINLRKLRFWLILYVLFDLYIGGHCAGIFPLGDMAAAQFTTVTGTVIDPNGLPYAGGTISAGLVIPSGAGSPTLNGSAYTPPSQPTGLDATGSFTMQLADNTVLLPASTKWTFLVCSAKGTVNPSIGKGSVCFSVASPITISGSSQSISTQLQAAALALTNVATAPGTVTTTGTPASGNLTKFSGASTITNTDLTGDVTTSGTTATTVGRINGQNVTGPPIFLFGNCGGASLNSGTNAVAVNGLGGLPTSGSCAGAGSSNRGTQVTHNCVLQNLYVHSSAAGTGASDGALTVLVANVGSALTCTLGTNPTCHDTTHTVSATAGQMITVNVTTTSTTTADYAVSMECD